ncbi:helix-turn-helix transcriptional regulator [Microcoleus sp. FACHB-672]|uniref:helix-turn-helix transcriptional regulator n=1 Tax=Microcoleus sp. FACHB-672 TaxID=2692825 RepID=UPI001689B75D|nr:helix-turn-helix transcriptional regulator [Microcoleus sp. FACHB-672]MBD2039214.1 helix-turn-helix transcriptional regulator [Microcoleus sp. FACHB-672]
MSGLTVHSAKDLPNGLRPGLAHGWCLACRDRTGTRKFRQLVNGICAECQRKAGILPVETPPEEPHPQPPKPQPSQCSQPLNSTEEKRLLEEQQLACALPQVHVGHRQWISEMAALLGWTKERTRTVGRRLRRKGIIIPPVNPSDSILQALQKSHKPLSVSQLAEVLPCDATGITQALTKLEQAGQVAVIRRVGFPNLYFAHQNHDPHTKA